MSGRARSNGMNSRRIASGETINFGVLAIKLDSLMDGYDDEKAGSQFNLAGDGCPWFIPLIKVKF